MAKPMPGEFAPLKNISSAFKALGASIGTLLVAAVLPFAISVGVVMAGRELGPPARYWLDGVHGVVVIFYLAAVIDIINRRFGAMTRMGFSSFYPRAVLNVFRARPTFSLLLASVLALAPLTIAMGIFFRWLGPAAGISDAAWFATPSHIIPEFVLTTILAALMNAAYGANGSGIGTRVKICGINSPEALKAATDAGANMLGFMFFPPSPRVVTPVEAKKLLDMVPEGVIKVAVFVDPDDHDVGAVVRQLGFHAVQLHGNESPERVEEIGRTINRPVIKAIAISGPDDVRLAHRYEAVADMLLLDAKAPEGSNLPGGNAVSFDWNLIAGETWEKPWLLAGGLTVENVARAIGVTNASIVDVSSGVEDAPGVKNPAKIKAFIRAAKGT